jgi:hypothetical protein
MKFDLKRMIDAIDSSKGSDGPGPKTTEEIAAYQKELAKKGLGWDPKTNRVYNLVGGASGTDMQYENRPDKNPMGLKTFETPSEDRMGYGWSDPSIKGVDRKAIGLDRSSTQTDFSDEELFNEGLRRDPQSGDIFPMKPGEVIKIGNIPYTWDKGRKISKPKK